MSTFLDAHVDQLAAYDTYVPGQQYYNITVGNMVSKSKPSPLSPASASPEIFSSTRG